MARTALEGSVSTRRGLTTIVKAMSALDLQASHVGTTLSRDHTGSSEPLSIKTRRVFPMFRSRSFKFS